MTRTRAVHFFPAAEVELRDAVAYYNEQCAGLGYEFAAEIRKTIDRINHFPTAWTKLSSRTRRCLANRFPYAVIFQHNDTDIFIVAVMHLKREPGSWQANFPKPIR
jgi:plasmid stabilization system protein ParE